MARDRTKSEGYEPGSPEAAGLSIEALSAEAASVGEDERIGAHAREVNLGILAIDPTNLAAGNRLAKCLRADGDLAGARTQLDRTLAAHPGNAVSLGEVTPGTTTRGGGDHAAGARGGSPRRARRSREG